MRLAINAASRLFRNVGKYLPDYTALHYRKLWFMITKHTRIMKRARFHGLCHEIMDGGRRLLV
jgi:hypothetical protein